MGDGTAGIILRMAGGQTGASRAETTDEFLADRVRASGDAVAFAELVTRYRVRLMALVRRMLGHGPDEAEDLVQETFVAAYRARTQYRRGERFRPWLYRIAVNRCIDRQRALGRNPVPVVLDEVVESVDAGEGPMDALLTDERSARVQAAIAELPPRYRAVFVLRHVDDLSYEEIAVAADLPVGTVKTHLFRARAQLREALKGLLDE